MFRRYSHDVNIATMLIELGVDPKDTDRGVLVREAILRSLVLADTPTEARGQVPRRDFEKLIPTLLEQQQSVFPESAVVKVPKSSLYQSDTKISA